MKIVEYEEKYLEDVRDLVNNLEKDNYGIAIEEFDFEKEYQIIIKIQK